MESNNLFLVNRLGYLFHRLIDQAEYVDEIGKALFRVSPSSTAQLRVYGEWLRHLASETYREMERTQAKECPLKLV